MNDSRQPIEQKEIDRLVDGELSETERRELLLRFDARGDSWRRLALAFIEIQVWGLEFKAMRSAAATAIERVPQSNQRRWSLGKSLLLVATILLALGLGFGLGWAWPTATHATIVDHKGQPNIEIPLKGEDRIGQQREIPAPPVETVKFILDDRPANDVGQIDLPLVDVVDLDPNWLQQQQPVVPRHIRQILERIGHQVDVRRSFYQLRLHDGREIVVPVDDVEVKLVGHQAFQ